MTCLPYTVVSSELQLTRNIHTLTSFLLEFYCPTSLKFPNMHYILLLHLYFPLSFLFPSNYSNFSKSVMAEIRLEMVDKMYFFFTMKPRLAIDNCHISIQCEERNYIMRLQPPAFEAVQSHSPNDKIRNA